MHFLGYGNLISCMFSLHIMCGTFKVDTSFQVHIPCRNMYLEKSITLVLVKQIHLRVCLGNSVVILYEVSNVCMELQGSYIVIRMTILP